MFKTIGHLLSLIRFSHTIFALPFAMLAAMMAWRLAMLDKYEKYLDGYQQLDDGTLVADKGPTSFFYSVGGYIFQFDWLQSDTFAFRWQEFLGILLCMIFARSAAMAFNRLVDRRIDALNPRTENRHLPAGILSVKQVTTFAMVCSLAFIASTLLFLPNRLPLYLSIPVLLFLGGYSYTKRFTSLAHVWLGMALGLSPIAAWIAIRGEAIMQHPGDLLPAWVLGGAVLTWVTGFDIIYACQDCEFDCQAKLNSIPTRLGIAGALKLAAGCHAVTVVLLALLPLVYPPLGTVYGVAVAGVALLLVYEHLLVSPEDLERVNTAFFHVNAVISIGLFAVGTLDLGLASG